VLDRFARVVEALLPPLRPNLYLQLALGAKDKNIVIAPHW
jgi:hypothetical protein